MSKFLLATRLHTLPNQTVSAPPLSSPDKQKKRARATYSLNFSANNSQYGFLHACLLELADGRAFLIAGESGAGKTTIAEHISRLYKARILAADWVAIEREGDYLFASDLNLADRLIQNDRMKLSGLIILTADTTDKRDAFSPSSSELQEQLVGVFDDLTRSEAAQLSQFWLDNFQLLSLCSIVPNLQGKLPDTLVTIDDLLRRQTLTSGRDRATICIVGTGNIGQTLAYRIAQMERVGAIKLVDSNFTKARGVALDIGHATAGNKAISAHQTSQQALKGSDIVFYCFRDSRELPPATDKVPERVRRYSAHLAILKTELASLQAAQFRGTIFVVSNPSDMLVYALHLLSQDSSNPLKTYQLYGVGLELDRLRAAYYAKQDKLESSGWTVWGSHSTYLAVDTGKTRTTAKIRETLYKNVQNASATVRQYTERTTYGPVEAAAQTLEGYLMNRPAHVTLLQHNGFLGGQTHFRGGLPSTLEHSSIPKLRLHNQKSFEKYGKFM